MICSKCNHKLPEDSEFCQYCGTKTQKAEETLNLDIEKMPLEEAAKYLVAEQLGEKYIPEDNQTIKKKTKTKYCSQCGSQIDHNTKKCTGCGKQYFRLTKFTITVVVLSLIIAAVSILCVLQYSNIQELKGEISTKQLTIDSLQSQVKSKQSTIDRLENEWWDNWKRLSFYEDSVVVVGDDGTDVYHKYGCSKLDTSNGYWIFNEEAAGYDGYKRCSQCND